jgi:D-mannonate dehydratase
MVNADARKEFIREMMIDSLSKSNKYSKDEIIKQLQRFFAFKLRKEHSEELVDEYNAEIAYLEEKIENLITQNGIDDENDKKAFKEKLPEYKKLEEIKTKLKNVKLSAVEEVQ